MTSRSFDLASDPRSIHQLHPVGFDDSITHHHNDSRSSRLLHRTQRAERRADGAMGQVTSMGFTDAQLPEAYRRAAAALMDECEKPVSANDIWTRPACIVR